MLLRKWTIHDLETSYKIDDDVLQDKKKHARIVVIDNEQVDNMVSNLRAAGYGDVTPLKNIASLEEVEKYDLILIDVKGIGLKFLKGTKSVSLEGLAMAREIKRQYPSKKVVVFSAMLQEWEDNYIIHNIVDGSFVKDGDISERNKKIDLCIRQLVDPVCLWKKNRLLLLEQGVPIHDVAKLEDKIVRAILKKRALPEIDIEKVVGNAVAITGLIKSISELVALTLR